MLIDELLQRVVKEQASDGFITAGAPPSIKIDGQIYPISKTRYTDEQTREIVLSTMSERQKEEFLRTHECNFALAVPELGRFRVNALVQRGSMGLVVRRIHTEIPRLKRWACHRSLRNWP